MKSKVVVTGGFGMVGSAVVAALNKRGIVPYVIDTWSNPEKWRNVRGLRFERIDGVESNSFPFWGLKPIIVHCGASVDTKEPMTESLWENNVEYTLRLSRRASKFIYMSSMSVYGAEEKDFSERIQGLMPMCPYALTKLHVDDSIFGSELGASPYTYALRLSNVYGKREQHKGDMASLVTKGLLKKEPLYQPEITESSLNVSRMAGGAIETIYRPARPTHWSLFKHPAGPILRDFVFADDVAEVIMRFIERDDIPSGIYNVGHGDQPRSFEDLVTAIEKLPIEHVPLPESLKNQYQRYTCADITKLRAVLGDFKFTNLEDGVEQVRAWMKEEGLI